MADNESNLTRREREIMDVIYTMGRATVNEIMERLKDPPCNAAVRNHLRILEDKGMLAHSADGKRYVYRPLKRKNRVAQSALKRVLKVYFGNSLERAVATHLADTKTKITEEELVALDELIQQVRKQRQDDD